MKTAIHFYCFDTDDANQAAAYDALRAELLATPGRGHCMDAAGDFRQHADQLDGQTIDLETAHLFENQWNTAPIEGVSEKGLRVFDWAETARSGRANFMRGNDFAPLNIRRGHYLDITPEMATIRAETVQCGYCGKQQPAEDAPSFCGHCLDSPYLKEDNLRLLRLLPVAKSFGGKRADLTDVERADLLPRFVTAQTTGANSRAAAAAVKARADAIAKANKAINSANVERDGILWLLDHGLSVSNVIYYSHTGRFSFGWRGALADSVTSQLLDKLTEFPFPYDIETDPAGTHGGRKLSAG